MKKTASYIATACIAAAASMITSSCNDNFETPPMYVPQATWKANITIAELKEMYWKTDRNYVATPGNLPGTNQHMYVSGRVISESASGNIYNSIIIQDATGALNVSVVTKDLTQSYLFGQEVIIDVTDLKLGGYNGLMQLGGEGVYNGAPSMTFMPGATLDAHAQLNGLGVPEKVDTLLTTVADLVTAKGSQQGLMKWQSQMIRLDNLHFETPGQPYATDKNTDRYALDDKGNRINIRTSSYASFKEALIPGGTGSVVGILSYYGSDWQILLNDTTGIIGFDPTAVPTVPAGTGNGTEDNPYTVAQVAGGATGTGVWTKGYIVGWVDGQVLADGARFTTPATAATNILLADKPDESDVKNCIPVQLPTGNIRATLNLVDHPENLGKEVLLKGDMEKYFGTAGIKNTADCKIDGQNDPTPPAPVGPVTEINQNFDASTAIPAGWTQLQVAGDKAWYIPTFNGNNYAAMTGYKGTAPFDSWLFTPAIDIDKAASKTLTFDTEVNGYGSKTTVFEVYVLDNPDPAKATVKTKLSPKIATAPASGYSEWVASGTLDLSAFKGLIYIGFRYYATADANYATWCVDNVKVNAK